MCCGYPRSFLVLVVVLGLGLGVVLGFRLLLALRFGLGFLLGLVLGRGLFLVERILWRHFTRKQLVLPDPVAAERSLHLGIGVLVRPAIHVRHDVVVVVRRRRRDRPLERADIPRVVLGALAEPYR